MFQGIMAGVCLAGGGAGRRAGFLKGEELLVKQGYKPKSFIFWWGQLNFQW